MDVVWNSVPYMEDCATAKALCPGRWYDDKGVVKCRPSDWSLWWSGFDF